MTRYDRDHVREPIARPRRPKWLSRYSPLYVAILLAVTGLLAIVCLSPSMFRNNWNAIDRVFEMEQVGWAGISWDGAYPAEQAALGVPCALKVTEVAPNGPADEAGLNIGDFIVGLNNRPFSDALELQATAREFRPGDTVTLNAVRAGEPLTFLIRLTSWAEIERLEIDGVGL